MEDEFDFDFDQQENLEEYILDEEMAIFQPNEVDTKDVLNELLGENAEVDNESEEIDLYDLSLDLNNNVKKEEEEFDFEEEFVIGDEFLTDGKIGSEKDHINADLLRGSFINPSTSSFWNIIARVLLELTLLKV